MAYGALTGLYRAMYSVPDGTWKRQAAVACTKNTPLIQAEAF